MVSPSAAPNVNSSTQAAAPLDLEAALRNDPNFTRERQVARQEQFGLSTGRAKDFIDTCEFVSLGCYCGPACAMMALGLRTSAYPFDWLRSSADGVIHCFDHQFVDFLTFANVKVEEGHQGYLSARWGGSFWHHKPDDLKVRDNFVRRIERLLGLENVPASKPRFFIRAANSSSEIQSSISLHQALQRALPSATIYLLILIDFQEKKGPACVKEGCSNVLFYFLQRDFWQGPADIHKSDEPYGEAIAYAVHRLSGSDRAGPSPQEFVNLAQLSDACAQWDGGSAAAELFAPKLMQGQPIVLRKSLTGDATVSPPSEAASARSGVEATRAAPELATPRLPKRGPHCGNDTVRSVHSLPAPLPTSAAGADRLTRSVQSMPRCSSVLQRQARSPEPRSAPRHAVSKSASQLPSNQGLTSSQPQCVDVRLAKNVLPGDVIVAAAFGTRVRVEVPAEACASQLLRLYNAGGVITYAAIAAATTAIAEIATTASVVAAVAQMKPQKDRPVEENVASA